ncbi:MAG: hypothetical protein WAZ18_01705 [Alphaproteobacteria bacterium]
MLPIRLIELQGMPHRFVLARFAPLANRYNDPDGLASMMDTAQVGHINPLSLMEFLEFAEAENAVNGVLARVFVPLGGAKAVTAFLRQYQAVRAEGDPVDITTFLNSSNALRMMKALPHRRGMEAEREEVYLVPQLNNSDYTPASRMYQACAAYCGEWEQDMFFQVPCRSASTALNPAEVGQVVAQTFGVELPDRNATL